MKLIANNKMYKIYESHDAEKLLTEVRTKKWRLIKFDRHGNKYRIKVARRKE